MMLENREIPIYVSTTAVGSKSLSKTVRKFNQFGIKNIELSYGVYEKNFKKIFYRLSKKNNFLFHNYFPKPKKNFVINLASFNKSIRLQSIKFIKKNIDFCSKNKISYYSFHAGFLIDPEPKHLGNEIPKILIQPRDKSIKLFIRTIKSIAKYAKERKIKIFIENNVISKQNLIKFKKNPLLMTNPYEIKKIMSKLPNNVKLLMDVAHLKVSSKTLNFNLVNSFKYLKRYTGAYHLSDNNGIIDNNRDVKKNSWFLNLITKVDFISIELDNKNLALVKKQLNLIDEKINNKI